MKVFVLLLLSLLSSPQFRLREVAQRCLAPCHSLLVPLLRHVEAAGTLEQARRAGQLLDHYHALHADRLSKLLGPLPPISCLPPKGFPGHWETQQHWFEMACAGLQLGWQAPHWQHDGARQLWFVGGCADAQVEATRLLARELIAARSPRLAWLLKVMRREEARRWWGTYWSALQ